MSDRQNSSGNPLPNHETSENDAETRPKSYYYDDSTGYEKFDDESDVDEEDYSGGESPGVD